jgi:uncharacterized membrane protein
MKISFRNESINGLVLIFTGSSNKSKALRISAIIIALMAVSIFGYYFMSTNEAYYSRTIAKIISVTQTKESLAYDMNGNSEQIYKQNMKAVVMNGIHKGEEILLENRTSYSKVTDSSYNVNDEVFIRINKVAADKIASADIKDFKRDKYISYIAILFIILIVLIGGFKGLRSLTSVLVNIIICSIVIELYLHGFNLILVSSIASILFIIVSIALVSGINKKTASAVIGTIAGTFFSMMIAIIVIWVTKAKGLYYEEMEFMVRPPEEIFIAEILIGTLGGIMDIAISISSALNELFEKSPAIENKVLIKSGMEIGKDIMGTMANTLVFAYVSGSIPMILLWLRNGFSTFTIVQFNICLEIIRALVGSIGIVISIPITLFISVLLIRKTRHGEP